MKVDDLKTWLVANIGSYISALSTAPVPLTALTSAMVYTRDFVEPQQSPTLFLDPLPEEVEQLTMGKSLVTAKVDAYWFVARGATESVAREQIKNYTQAMLNALQTHVDYFGFEAREYFDGVEGKVDIKAARTTLIFRTEE